MAATQADDGHMVPRTGNWKLEIVKGSDVANVSLRRASEQIGLLKGPVRGGGGAALLEKSK
jgi:hypothetical protein